MASALLTLLKWLAFGWAAATLLGALVLAGIIFWPGSSDDAQADVRIDGAGERRRQVQQMLSLAGLGTRPLLALEEHECAGWGGVDARRVRIAPGALDPDDAFDWHEGDRLPLHARLAVEKASHRLQQRHVAWMPSIDAITSIEYQVRVRQVGFVGDEVDSFDLVLLRPATGSAYLLRGNGLQATTDDHVASEYAAASCDAEA